MSRLKTRRWWLALLLGLLAINDGPSPGQANLRARQRPPLDAMDPRLEPIHRAALSWESRQGPARKVVDQVCLVSDLPGFLEAISTWDRGHYFPVLFDDVESSFRFIRAFRPARIVRMPKSGAPFGPGETWARAVRAVGASWSSGAQVGPDGLPGDQVPKPPGPTTPGVVLSSPTAPMLAGAVALAAGRFQPLLRFDPEKRFADVLSTDEADALARAVAETVARSVPAYDQLGDDCDFLTIAGDYPYRYRDVKGEQDALDDRIGRPIGSDRRWAFAGRILGDAVASTYAAMCSLFLQPESALMFNGYDEAAPPWSNYSMRVPSLRLSAALPTSHVSGDLLANLEGWHDLFDASGHFGLVLIQSHGSPTEFHLRGGPAHAPDIPRVVPSAILMIHSFSAAEPNDPSTIAGRWLANGAFVFFGSMNEPYLDAFRLPRVVADLIAEKVPLVVAARQMPGETRGQPWRLVFLGDPLYRIDPKAASGPSSRLDRWGPTSEWPAYSEAARPADGADVGLFSWSLKVALARLQGANAGRSLTPGAEEDLVETLRSIRREKLPIGSRPVYDALLIEVLLEGKKRTALKARLLALPGPERGPGVRRTLETLLTTDLYFSLAQQDASKARAAWLELMKTPTPREFKEQITARVGKLADSPARVDEWRRMLRSVLRDGPRPPESEIIADALKRLDESLKPKR